MNTWEAFGFKCSENVGRIQEMQFTVLWQTNSNPVQCQMFQMLGLQSISFNRWNLLLPSEIQGRPWENNAKPFLFLLLSTKTPTWKRNQLLSHQGGVCSSIEAFCSCRIRIWYLNACIQRSAALFTSEFGFNQRIPQSWTRYLFIKWRLLQLELEGGESDIWMHPTFCGSIHIWIWL